MSEAAGQGTPAPEEGGQGVPSGEGNPGNPAPQDTPFYSTFEDENVRTWAEGKGFKSVEQAVRSGMHAEKMIGVPADRLVKIPQEGDVQGQDEFYRKLGRPQEPSQYEFKLPEGAAMDEAFAGSMKEVFHKAGLTPQQAQAISEAYGSFMVEDSSKSQEEYEQATQVQEAQLQKDWGEGYDRMLGLAKQTVAELGIPGEAIDGIESVMGYSETMKLVADIGKRLLEDNFAGEGTRTGFGSNMTPAEAKNAWEEFKADQGNVAALMDRKNPGHDLAMKRKSELFALMYPNG